MTLIPVGILSWQVRASLFKSELELIKIDYVLVNDDYINEFA